MFNLKAPLFKGGWGGSNAIKQPTFPPILIKATIPLNVLLYNMFNLKAPLFKGGWGGSDAIKQPTFPAMLKKQQPHRKTLFSQGKY
jgi:hypothetical protein